MRAGARAMLADGGRGGEPKSRISRRGAAARVRAQRERGPPAGGDRPPRGGGGERRRGAPPPHLRPGPPPHGLHPRRPPDELHAALLGALRGRAGGDRPAPPPRASIRGWAPSTSSPSFRSPAPRMADAVAAARRLGEEVGRRFALPVYLYEAAATRPERRALPDIRRGGFEGFADQDARPGVGARLRPGAPSHPDAPASTVIGARVAADRLQRHPGHRRRRDRAAGGARGARVERRPAGGARHRRLPRAPRPRAGEPQPARLPAHLDAHRLRAGAGGRRAPPAPRSRRASSSAWRRAPRCPPIRSASCGSPWARIRSWRSGWAPPGSA